MCLGKGTQKGPAPLSAYSPECVEGNFYELRPEGFLKFKVTKGAEALTRAPTIHSSSDLWTDA
jgi:hypothetical protein